MEEKFISVADAAELLGVHSDTILRWIRCGKIPAYRASPRGSYRLRKEELLETLRCKKVVSNEG